MSSKIEDGGAAFPHQFEDVTGNKNWMQSEGMSLRDWFAAQAMPELIRDVGDRLPFCEVAQMSYEMADEMIAARKADAE